MTVVGRVFHFRVPVSGLLSFPGVKTRVESSLVRWLLVSPLFPDVTSRDYSDFTNQHLLDDPRHKAYVHRSFVPLKLLATTLVQFLRSLHCRGTTIHRGWPLIIMCTKSLVQHVPRFIGETKNRGVVSHFFSRWNFSLSINKMTAATTEPARGFGTWGIHLAIERKSIVKSVLWNIRHTPPLKDTAQHIRGWGLRIGYYSWVVSNDWDSCKLRFPKVTKYTEILPFYTTDTLISFRTNSEYHT